MEPASANAAQLVVLLVLSVILLLFHILLQGFLATRELGSAWNAGPRDEERQPKNAAAGRARRASSNYQETYPAFIGLLLGLAFFGDPSGVGVAGAWTWLIARIVYIPLYLAGIPYIRSLAWLVSIVGLVVMMATLLF
ncbi:membrane protein [Pseudorhizobium endolithicum]|uniref:Membrane protein n=1 Tax=Pseudorhizobium endolithicum TaxID=1191678 RepID=A0ABN7JQS0_9HYPH|nr:MAPEG family protein [Pseudorhizobium endolithicum]CAD6432042.1 membrane protein [Rhizobium sp. Q54]CAD7042621.1 membrane protein [Pseudorhizobium endolithicum]